MIRTRRISVLAIALLVSLVSACSSGSSSSNSESAEESVCSKLRKEIAEIEDNASIISLSPSASPSNLELFGLGIAIKEAGLPTPYESDYAYVDVLNLLANAEACFSDEALLYLNNYLEAPLNKALREADGN